MGVRIFSRDDKTENIEPTGQIQHGGRNGEMVVSAGFIAACRDTISLMSDQPGRFINKRGEFAHKKQEQTMPMDQLDRALTIVVTACCNVAPHANLADTRM